METKVEVKGGCACEKASKVEAKYFIYRESAFQSFFCDFFTFAWLLFSFWFNYKFIGGSYMVNAILLVMFLLMLSFTGNQKRKVFTRKEDAIKFINEI